MKKWLKSNSVLLLFLCLDGLVVLAHFLFKNVYGFFDLDGEQNLNSVYSGLKLMFLGGLGIVQFLVIRHLKEGWGKKLVWLLVALSFIYLGTDEMVAFHERVGFVMNNLTGLTGFKGASFNWPIYFAPLIALTIIVYFKLLIILWQENRESFWIVLIGFGFLIAALASEIIGGRIIYPRGVISRDFHLYFIFIIIEEAFELLGATFFLAGVFNAVKKKTSALIAFYVKN